MAKPFWGKFLEMRAKFQNDSSSFRQQDKSIVDLATAFHNCCRVGHSSRETRPLLIQTAFDHCLEGDSCCRNMRSILQFRITDTCKSCAWPLSDNEIEWHGFKWEFACIRLSRGFKEILDNAGQQVCHTQTLSTYTMVNAGQPESDKQTMCTDTAVNACGLQPEGAHACATCYCGIVPSSLPNSRSPREISYDGMPESGSNAAKGKAGLQAPNCDLTTRTNVSCLLHKI